MDILVSAKGIICMKKYFLAAALSALMLTGTVFAAEADGSEILVGESVVQPIGSFYHEAIIHDSASLMSDNNYEEGYTKLLEGLENADTVIHFDEDDFCFTIDESNYDENDEFAYTSQFADIFRGFVDQHPELFYITNGYGCGYVLPQNGTYYISELYPDYTMSKPEIDVAKKDFKKLTGEIAEYVNENADSALEKAILLHDYIVINYEYDTSLIIHDAYRFMKEGKGVCESYSKLYKYVLGLCGVESKYSSSEQMNHVWNTVKIDGEWYHVDATWDDPTPNTPGHVSHDYFLVGDEDFASADIYGYGNGGAPLFHYAFSNEDGIVCEESYADAFWGHMAEENDDGFVFAGSAPIVFDNENYYYTAYNQSVHTSAIVARSKKDSLERNVVTFNDLWYVPGTTSFYPGNFSGLSLIDGVLIYNTPTEVRYVFPNGAHNTLIKKIAKEDSHFGDKDGYIYRFGTSLDGKFWEHEPFYTHIDTPDSNNNSGWYGEGKDRYRIEIDYFIASDPGESGVERDIDVRVDFDDIHSEEKNKGKIKENILRKPTFATKGKKETVCEECAMYQSTVTDSYSKDDGEKVHKYLVDILKFIGGASSNEFKETVKEDLGEDIEAVKSENDIDNDGRLSLHDINEIFKILREEKSDSEAEAA